MTAKDYREKENWNKADFFKGEYDIDLNSIDEYAEAYHQYKLKLLGIADVVGQSEQLKAFLLWLDKDYDMGDTADVIVKDYLKSL